jgi:hypothetical protein
METVPPPVGSGHCGQPMNLSYTEEVVGSAGINHPSPIPPTFYLTEDVIGSGEYASLEPYSAHPSTPGVVGNP